ncbi:hypothetical protein VNO80_29962 [Phaseolus coccineus]|uniref:Uncharacterized protein n=1 Tax=Phaseolus coccineus TaxID=3886 RepID=A0AAN9QFD1_PHACN
MEKIEEGGNTKEKMDPDMDSSSKHVEAFQAEKHDKDPNLEQNLMDPNSKRNVSNHSAKRSRKKKMAKTIKKLEARAKVLQDLYDILQPIAESQKKQMRDLMEEEQALLQEMQYLQEKALLRDGKVVSSLEFFYMEEVDRSLHKARKMGIAAMH